MPNEGLISYFICLEENECLFLMMNSTQRNFGLKLIKYETELRFIR